MRIFALLLALASGSASAACNFPTSLESLPNPPATWAVNVPFGGLTHSGLHGKVNDCIENMQAVIGITDSAVTTSHEYRINALEEGGGGGGSGTVTHTTGALTSSALIVGNGSADIKPLASLGTTTTVLHGNAAGLPTFGPVSLTADVSGILDPANGGTGVDTLAGLRSAIEAQPYDDLLNDIAYASYEDEDQLLYRSYTANGMLAAKLGTGISITTGVLTLSANLQAWHAKSAPSGDVVGTTDAQPLTNKTLGSGSAIDLGSDATGDILYRNSGGDLARLAIGSSGQVLTVDTGLPSWAAATGSTPGSAALSAAITALTPTAYWRLNEASGNFEDSAGSYDAVATGTIVYNSSALLPDAGARYARFATTGSSYGATSSLLGITPPVTGSWSVIAMVNPINAGSNSKYVFAINGSGETEANNDQVLVYYSSSGLFAFWEYGAGTNVTISGPTAMPANSPTLIHVVKDSSVSRVTFYVNGAYAGSSTYANEPTGGSSANAKVMGTTASEAEIVGGEVAFFNGVAHSIAQVETIAKAAGVMGK